MNSNRLKIQELKKLADEANCYLMQEWDNIILIHNDKGDVLYEGEDINDIKLMLAKILVDSVEHQSYLERKLRGFCEDDLYFQELVSMAHEAFVKNLKEKEL